jgi:hypothetical protein
MWGRLETAPPVGKLREARSAPVAEAVRAELAELAGAGPDFRALTGADITYLYALTLVLEGAGDETDLPRLFSLWCHHPSLHDFGRFALHGDAGDAFLASVFGKEVPYEKAYALQPLAANAALRRDPEGARATVLELAQKERHGESEEKALTSIFKLLAKEPAPPSPAWAEAAAAAATLAACDALCAWKHPLAARAHLVVLDRAFPLDFQGAALAVLQRQPEAVGSNVDSACRRLELLGDASVVPRLREALTRVPAFSKGTTKRIELTIGRLLGAFATGHRIEVTPAGRSSCRGCKDRLVKGEPRFGEEMPGYDAPPAEMRWYHLACGAEKKPAIFLQALGAYEGQLPDRKELEATAQARLARKGKKKRSPSS